MKLYPIVNSQTDFKSQALELIGAIAVNPFNVERLELSFACPDLLDNLAEIYDYASQKRIKLGLASLIDLDQLFALKIIAEPWLQEVIEVFAPALDNVIMKTIQEDLWMSQYLKYIPGVFSEADVNALLKAGYSENKFKIYPLEPCDGAGFFKSMQGPYPELRDYKPKGKKTMIITSPRDYQKLRKKKHNWDFQVKQRSAQSIIDYIKILVPQSQVIISGLGGDLGIIKSLTGFDYLATRMSVNELSQYSTLSA